MIVQLDSFDITTASPYHMLASAGLWSALPRLTQGVAAARILVVGDTLKAEDVIKGFESVSAPFADLSSGARAYRLQYETFLRQTARDVRYMKVYLVMDTDLDEEGFCRLLRGYGLAARPLADPLPRPFQGGKAEWDHVLAPDGTRWRLLRSDQGQTGSIFPRSLHRLFELDFPLWIALNVNTIPDADAIRNLRLKEMAARYAPRRSNEESQEAAEVGQAIDQIRYEMNRASSALHWLSLYVMYGGQDGRELRQRDREIAAACPLSLYRVTPPGKTMADVFSAEAFSEPEGSLLTTPGVALFAGSVLSYRRPTRTQGVLVGADKNAAPVIVNLFSDAKSFNAVVLGQTGSGKTFATLSLMLRHYLLGARLIIVDPQGNVDLGFLMGDYQRNVIGTAAAAINVMDIVHDEIASQVDGVTAMLAILGVYDRDDSLSRAVLDDALMAIYAPIWDVLPDYGELPPEEVPTLGDVRAELERIAEEAGQVDISHTATLLAFKLTPFISGSQSDWFGQRTTADFSLNHPVTVFDISNIPGQESGSTMRAAMLAILVGSINRGIRRLRLRGIQEPILFFIDEIGMLLLDPVIANFTRNQFKTARARRVGMIVADQDLTSFLGAAGGTASPGGSMLANAAYKLIFRQEADQLENIRRYFPDLPDSVVARFPALDTGVCVLKMPPNDLLVVSVLASPFDFYALSSELQYRAVAKSLVETMRREIAAVTEK